MSWVGALRRPRSLFHHVSTSPLNPTVSPLTVAAPTPSSSYYWPLPSPASNNKEYVRDVRSGIPPLLYDILLGVRDDQIAPAFATSFKTSLIQWNIVFKYHPLISEHHEEIEIALVKLYRVTGNTRYLRLSQYFIDERGQTPYYFDTELAPDLHKLGLEYHQAHKPVPEQTCVSGYTKESNNVGTVQYHCHRDVVTPYLPTFLVT